MWSLDDEEDDEAALATVKVVEDTDAWLKPTDRETKAVVEPTKRAEVKEAIREIFMVSCARNI